MYRDLTQKLQGPGGETNGESFAALAETDDGEALTDGRGRCVTLQAQRDRQFDPRHHVFWG